MKKKNVLSFTVGIATCFGDPSILETMRSLRSSRGIGSFPIILVADRVPLSTKIKSELRKLKVTFIENKREGSQVAKQKQILKLVKTDLLILTQDDVILDKNALSQVIKKFEKNPTTTMISILNKPLPAKTHFEKVLGVGTHIANLEAKYWNHGDNYLSVIGRFMAFRVKTYKKFRLPKTIATSDAYYYLENKRVGGHYEYIPHVAVKFINPRNMKEHLRKSSRFQFSLSEMSNYFMDINHEYAIPLLVIFLSLQHIFFEDPILMIEYLFVFAYTRAHRMKQKAVLNPIWEVDLSTKKIALTK